ncbi:hypothetical protein KAU09_03355 [Candidatus Parcubacteria bacterium]|nr:hypothetical protein [Candidatus Parcubacteria bacterium]
MQKINNKKLLNYIYFFIIFAGIISFVFLAEFLQENIYKTITIDSEFLLSQSKTKKENLDIRGFEKIIENTKNKTKPRQINYVNNIFTQRAPRD